MTLQWPLIREKWGQMLLHRSQTHFGQADLDRQMRLEKSCFIALYISFSLHPQITQHFMWVCTGNLLKMKKNEKVRNNEKVSTNYLTLYVSLYGEKLSEMKKYPQIT